jgi:hypothetical protein
MEEEEMVPRPILMEVQVVKMEPMVSEEVGEDLVDYFLLLQKIQEVMVAMELLLLPGINR